MQIFYKFSANLLRPGRFDRQVLVDRPDKTGREAILKVHIKKVLLNRIATLLGGRAAEEIIFSDISTGAHNDLSQATDIVRSMVTQYGMSAKAGQVYLAREKRSQFIDVPGFGSPAEYSEATAELIAAEIKEIIQEQYTVAFGILRGKQPLLDKGAVLLLEKETITGSELQELGRSLETADA